jgi:hypothetical protein
MYSEVPTLPERDFRSLHDRSRGILASTAIHGRSFVGDQAREFPVLSPQSHPNGY